MRRAPRLWQAGLEPLASKVSKSRRLNDSLQALPSPDEAFAERCKGGAFAPLSLDQRRLKELPPAFDQVPSMAIGNASLLDRARDRPACADIVQEIQHDEQRLVSPSLRNRHCGAISIRIMPPAGVFEERTVVQLLNSP